MDSIEVQNKEQVSLAEQVSLPTVVAPLEPSPEERMAALVEQKVAEAIARSTEAAKREIQSTKDRATAEVNAALRRASLAESTLGEARTHLQDVDPEVAKEMELVELRSREKGRKAMEQEEAMRQQQIAFHEQFHSNLTQFITGLGVDPSDKRIDWGSDSPNYLEAQRRVLDSVSKIQKENIQTMQSGLEKRLKDLEAKVGQANIEANSVATTTSPGVVAGSDTEFVKKFASGELPASRANVERYQKIQSSY